MEKDRRKVFIVTEGIVMNTPFADTLKKLRKEKGISQYQLGDLMYVDHSTVARWENGLRLPDAAMITRLAKVLETDVGTLLSTAAESDDSLSIIVVDDNPTVLSDSMFVLEKVVPPNATITGFNWPQEVIEYAKVNRIDLAILDIELGTENGLDLCHKLLELNPCTNVVYLTAYPDYALGAWKTDACGFMLKPLTPEEVRRQLKKLNYPFRKGGIKK